MSATTNIQQVFAWPGDPNGKVPDSNDKFTTLPLICVDLVNKVWWAKTDGVASATGWDRQ